MKSIIRLTSSTLILVSLTTIAMGGIEAVAALSLLTVALVSTLMLETALQSYATPYSWKNEAQRCIHPKDPRSNTPETYKEAA